MSESTANVSFATNKLWIYLGPEEPLVGQGAFAIRMGEQGKPLWSHDYSQYVKVFDVRPAPLDD